ncbi:hypothetical protein IU459_13350 [Nocardia amamiensis]|uniref:DUF6973 domain-containing protein n=1 Tax=Nocardia amamiensis TaxID=404578 RepID=A0ABS0CQU9_9NOCA|nr:hypothetical protein [Nocardia amamiensis]MBF6298520.1 hypothetical protein [Nocardia amamiensis]
MSGGSYTTPLTVPMVLSWDPRATIAIANAFKDAALRIDEQTHQAASRIDMSYTYFKGSVADSARNRAAEDRDHARRTKQVLIDIQQQVYIQIDAIVGYIDVIKDKKAEAESAKFDSFVRDNGGVDSRMSNTEVLMKYGPTGLVEKEGLELYLTTQIRAALTAIQQADLQGAEKIKRLLEDLSPETQRGVTKMPQDPSLAEVLTKFQTAPSSAPATLWPSGFILDRIRAVRPDFQPILMTPEEIALLSSRMARPGTNAISEITDFFEIKAQAEAAAKKTYPHPEENALNDGHGDAFRHMYWNALMTQRYGAEWTENYGTAHEGLGANPPAREAMDLHNNSIGRQIAIDNPNSSPEELQRLINQRIQNGGAIVLDPDGQVAWSNQVEVEENGHPARADIPLPAGR